MTSGTKSHGSQVVVSKRKEDIDLKKLISFAQVELFHLNNKLARKQSKKD